MSTKKIIILASERSGTNLFRTLLNNHKDISGPVAPHFFDGFVKFIDDYGDLAVKENAELLISHMIRLANHKYHDWKLEVAPSYLVDKYGVNSFETAFNAMYSEKAFAEGKLHYASKDNHLFYYDRYLNKLDDVSYVYLQRDPRDHIASWLRTPLYLHTPLDIARKWNKEQRKILNLEAKGNTVHYLKYEDLIASPEEEMTKVLNFVGLEIDANCFRTDAENKESERNEFWKNLSKPIISTNAKKYKKALSAKDIRIIESVSKPIMEKLKYEFDTKADWKPFKGYGIELRLKRMLSKRKHKDLFNKKMIDLKDKLNLISSFKKELE